MSVFSCVLIGNKSLVAECGALLLDRGHSIAAVVSRHPEVRAWATGAGLRVEAPGAGLADRLHGTTTDWLFSIANLSVVPGAVLAMAGKGAINFHDGPLPRYAGLNAPAWAILNGETQHGVTWHMIEGGIDEGDIVGQKLFDLDPGETAFTLNAKCYAAAIESFGPLVADIEEGGPVRRAQDLGQRTYFARDDRPAVGGRLDFTKPARVLAALVRGLDFGPYWNPLGEAKIATRGRLLVVGGARVVDAGNAWPGTVLSADMDRIVVATGEGAIELSHLTEIDGTPVSAMASVTVGTVLPALDKAAAESVTSVIAKTAAGERHWRRALKTLEPASLSQAMPGAGAAVWASITVPVPGGLSGSRLLAALAAWASRATGAARVDLAYRDSAVSVLSSAAQGGLSPWVPVRLEAEGLDFDGAAVAFADALAAVRAAGSFAIDLPLRDPAIGRIGVPDIALALGPAAPIEGAVLTLALGEGTR